MTEHHLAPRYVAPYLVSGASGLHILIRMWRLSRLPASDASLHAFFKVLPIIRQRLERFWVWKRS